MLRHRGPLARSLALHALACLAALAAPQLLGRIVEGAARGTLAVTPVALAICAAVVLQAVFTRFARLASLRLGETVLAELREEFVDRVLSLPTPPWSGPGPASWSPGPPGTSTSSPSPCNGPYPTPWWRAPPSP
nr:hypothetical protein [Streptomyces sp. I6]